jgi:hypothetical protein
MKAKEKAEQLVNSFYYALPNNGSSTGLNSTTIRFKEATVCALIAVDEIFEFMKMDDEYTETLSNANSKWVGYLQEVKKEIELIGGDE